MDFVNVSEESRIKWDKLRKLEEKFVDSPSLKKGLKLSKLWTEWVENKGAKEWYSHIGIQRMFLYSNYIFGEINNEEILRNFKENPLD